MQQVDNTWLVYQFGSLPPEMCLPVSQVSAESAESVEVVQEEAAAILEEMAHRLQLSTVRFFAFTLSKAFKSLFRSVCVNEEGIQRVGTDTDQSEKDPVALLGCDFAC